jgi:hypothetical protein
MVSDPIRRLIRAGLLTAVSDGRPPTFTYRWWVQFFGHIPFVPVPIASMIAGGVRQSARAPSPTRLVTST